MTLSSVSVELRLPSDPALAITVRTFVRTSAPSLGLSEDDVEILCLAATELLANAVENAQPSLELTLSTEGGRWTLWANGVGPLRAVEGDPIDRRALLSGIAEVAIDAAGRVELSAAAPK
jgi:anti-sigma regulatory factor (Ser/Thr protein kinase)